MRKQRDLFWEVAPEEKVELDLSRVSAQCRLWIERAAEEGILYVFLQTLIESGVARDSYGALAFINEVILANDVSRNRIFGIDFKSPRRALQSLRTFLSSTEKVRKGFDNIVFLHGTVSHRVILNFESRARRARTDVLKRVSGVLDELTSAAATPKQWMDAYARCEVLVRELETLLRPFFGEYIDRLPRGPDPYYKYLKILTFCTWARVVLEYTLTRKPRLFVKEVPVMPSRFGVSGGRIDALEIRSVSGRGPTDNEQTLFLGAVSRIRHFDLVHVVDLARKCLGPDIEFGIIDKKFSIGDSSTRNIFKSETVSSSALREHIEQVEGYLMFASLGYYLVHRKEFRNPWTHAKSPQKGYIEYHVPDGPCIVHAVSASSDCLENLFCAKVVQRLSRGVENARIRKATSLIMKEVNGARAKNAGVSSGAAQLELDASFNQGPLDILIDRHRVSCPKCSKIKKKILKKSS